MTAARSARTVLAMTSEQPNPPLNVLIAGGGVAGLETMMALRELAGPRVSVTLLTPDEEFVYKPLSVLEPFAGPAVERRAIAPIAADFGAELKHGAIHWVAPRAHSAFTTGREELTYDVLVLALGAHRSEPFPKVTTFAGSEDSEKVHGIVQDVESGDTQSVDFVVPPGITWPLPLYELALMMAARAKAMNMSPVLRIITPEESPLSVFGAEASADVAKQLDDAGIAFVGSEYARQVAEHPIVLHPSGHPITAERIITVPTLTGTAPGGIYADTHRFIRTDRHGRVHGLDDVYAAGDGTDFPIKQGGIAAQQADAIAEVIAKRAGAPIEPRSFQPVVRAMLLTGEKRRFLRGEVSRGRDGISEAADHALWWPPTKIAGRYLAPYLEGSGIYAERRPSYEIQPPVQGRTT
jgi:sulfide:quinone oxidoreductase